MQINKQLSPAQLLPKPVSPIFIMSKLFWIATGILPLPNVPVKPGFQRNANMYALQYIILMLPSLQQVRQGWGKPSHRQLLGYDKGARMSSLFPPRPLCSKASNLRPYNVSTKNLEKFAASSSLFTMLTFEERNKVEIIAAESLVDIVRLTESKIIEEKAKQVSLEIFTLQMVNNLHGMDCEILKSLYTFYKHKICCDIDKALIISIGTITQSENSEWYQERKLRITASNGHKAKGHHYNINEVTTGFLNPEKIETSAMSYGKKTEKQALEEYKKLIKPGWEVVKVGLIVNISQPWLSCSPDGILVYGSNIWEKRLIDIKCSHSCRNKPVFDEEFCQTNINYLKFDENGLQLSTTHSYYTQIQLQMYITNIAFCDLFVYSPSGSVLITIGRDDGFLKNVIPRLQQFYFTYYLPKLSAMYSTNLD